MYVYKSLTGHPINIDNYVVTVSPGLESKYQIEVLDLLIGTSIERYTDGVLDSVDDIVPSNLINGSLVFSGTSSTGVKVGKTSPNFGWRDLIGDITPKTQGVGSPALAVISGNLRGYNYATGEDGDCVYHLPHDYVIGTDLFIHTHWLHNGTNISGALSINIYASYAKGHNQQAFHTEKLLVLSDSSLNITNTPALRHRIPEIQLSTPGGSANLLDTSLIEPDGVVIIHYDVATIPTITGGTGKPFLLTFDIHYQSSNLATRNKAPNFYI